ncbi:MAG: NAD(P)/FAD-dependent oxidoreductase [Bacteroidales bacterium]|nr:NAD(P)/FAD-dependent oxidoreductase [Bacteroidales bacterium]
MKKYNVIIIGAGASGILASISACEQGASVLLLEKMSKEARKMLISGKGRCNITNTAYQSDFFKKIYPKPKFLKHAFSTFFSKDILNMLEEKGLKTKTERGGRVFPESDKAADVVNSLLQIVREKGIDIKKNAKVEDIIVENNKIRAVKASIRGKLEIIETENVILCTGGKSYPATGSTGDGFVFAKTLGHKITELRPALVPLKTEGDIAEKLQGLSLKNSNVSIWVNNKKIRSEFGEMMFAHYGLTGPVILTLSKIATDSFDKKNNVEISIDLKPALDEQKLDNRLQRELNESGKKQIRNILKNLLPSKLIPVVLELTKIDPYKECNQISGKERKKIRVLLKDLRFKVSGHRGFKEAIVTAGGIDTNEIDSRTMMSKIIDNLYFAGEIIDLDAETGGYNFQIAFSTGWLAGKSCIVNKKEKF